jgi:hypothetical protein
MVTGRDFVTGQVNSVRHGGSPLSFFNGARNWSLVARPVKELMHLYRAMAASHAVIMNTWKFVRNKNAAMIYGISISFKHRKAGRCYVNATTARAPT